MDSHDTFPQRVWQIVASIPEGYVATYGDVAQLAGSPRAARQVGGVLKRLPEGSHLPWHRVVNRHGDISLTGPDLQRQRQALLAEGVLPRAGSCVESARHFPRPGGGDSPADGRIFRSGTRRPARAAKTAGSGRVYVPLV